MIDLHSHIINGVDDGSTSLKESINILKKAKRAGFSSIVLTPHFIPGSKDMSSPAENKKKLKELQNLLDSNDIKIKLYLGNEVYFDNNINKYYKENKLSTINSSKYILFELPMNETLDNFYDVVFNMQIAGLKPILAHPERYKFVKDDPTVINDILNRGVLLQSNYGSFIGLYGKEAQKTVRLLLKHNMISFLGSDTHHETDIIYDNVKEVLNYIEKKQDKEYMKLISNDNIKKILNNKEVYNDYTLIKKGLFNTYK